MISINMGRCEKCGSPSHSTGEHKSVDARKGDEKFEAKMAEYHAWRGIDYPCEECQGTGKKTYGSTATFWGGIGGAAMTTSVCDKCWGSGEKHRPWKSWKLIAAELKERAPLYDKLRIELWKYVRDLRGLAKHENLGNSVAYEAIGEELEKIYEKFS